MDEEFWEMCTASNVTDAPTKQLVDMRRAFYGGALIALSKTVNKEVEALFDILEAFKDTIGTKEEQLAVEKLRRDHRN